MPLPAAVVHGIAHPPTAPSEPPGASDRPSTITGRSRCAQSMDADLEQLVDEFIKIALVARGQSLSLPVRENRNSIEMTSHPDVDDIPSGEIRRIASNIRRAPARSNLRMRNCPMNPASRSYSDTID